MQENKEEFAIINLRDVDFIEKESKYVVYYIGKEKYYQFTTKSELEDLLIEAGFDSLDRANLVNMGKIKSYNKDYGKVYFEDTPGPDSKYATVAKVKEKAVEQFIKFIINDNKDVVNELRLPQPKGLGDWFKSLVNGEAK